LHSIRSLLSTATNATPHERFLVHPRRNMYGASMPSWLANGNTKVLLKRHVRSSKYEPLVDEVELLEANHQYAHIRYPDGRESTVSTRHLAPAGGEVLDEYTFLPDPHSEMDLGSEEQSGDILTADDESNANQFESRDTTDSTNQPDTVAEPSDANRHTTPTLRRSQRQRRAPVRYGYG